MNYEILEIGEHKLPCRFGFNALRKFSMKTGATITDLNKLSNGQMTFNDAFTLIYCGVEDGHRAAKKEFRMSVDDITDLFDGNMDSMEEAFNILGRAMNTGLKGKGQAKKKKTKKTS